MARNLPKQLQNGLILWLDSAGKDLSWNWNNGTLVNAPTKVRRLQNDGLSYNGSNQSVTVSTSLPMVAYNWDRTWSAWVYLNVNNVYNTIFNYSGGTGVDNKYWWEWFNINNVWKAYTRFFTQANSQELWGYGTTVLSTWKWYMITAVKIGINITDCKIYVNAVSESLTNASIGTLTANITAWTPFVWVRWNTTELPMNWKILNPMIWNRALSATEIQLLHKCTFIK